MWMSEGTVVEELAEFLAAAAAEASPITLPAAASRAANGEVVPLRLSS